MHAVLSDLSTDWLGKTYAVIYVAISLKTPIWSDM